MKTSTSHGVAKSSDSNASSSSMLECRVYAKHSIREDNFIGGSKDRMKLLFAEGTGGGLYIFGSIQIL